MRSVVAGLKEPKICDIELPSRHGMRLGGIRNSLVDIVRGDFIAQWDDDDWYAPARLEIQIQAIERSGIAACCLLRWTVFDAETGAAYISQRRPWEGSLIARRDVMPRYPDLSRGEDTPVIRQLIEKKQLVLLDRPDLYVYVYHGGNTWPREHFERNIVRHSQRLSNAEALKIADMIAIDPKDSVAWP